MTKGRASSDNRQEHLFGGDWTTAKLAVLDGYLKAYTTALKNTSFQKIYVDGFAGTGYREMRPTVKAQPEELLFPDLAEPEPQHLLDGSARLALKAEPRFDRYVFVELKAEYCEQLQRLKSEFPALARDIEIRQGDANREIQLLCKEDWRKRRAVLFLDPYGMQVDWTTVQAVAETKAIDMWLLFPLGMGVNRLLSQSGDIPESWRQRLDTILGTSDWYDAFYKIVTKEDLNGSTREVVIKARIEEIGRFFVHRLKSVFAGVIEEPGILRNSKNNPLYLVCFAAGNDRGAPVALSIAEHLLKDLR